MKEEKIKRMKRMKDITLVLFVAGHGSVSIISQRITIIIIINKNNKKRKKKE